MEIVPVDIQVKAAIQTRILDTQKAVIDTYARALPKGTSQVSKGFSFCGAERLDSPFGANSLCKNIQFCLLLFASTTQKRLSCAHGEMRPKERIQAAKYQIPLMEHHLAKGRFSFVGQARVSRVLLVEGTSNDQRVFGLKFQDLPPVSTRFNLI